MTNEITHPESLVSQKPVPETPPPGKKSVTRRSVLENILQFGVGFTAAFGAAEIIKNNGASEAVADIFNAASEMAKPNEFSPPVKESAEPILLGSFVDETAPEWGPWSRIKIEGYKVLSADGTKVLFDGQQFLPGDVFTPTAATLSADGLLLRVDYTRRPSTPVDHGIPNMRDRQPRQLNAKDEKGVLIIARPESDLEQVDYIKLNSGESIYFVESGVVVSGADRVIAWDAGTKKGSDGAQRRGVERFTEKSLTLFPYLTEYGSDTELMRQILIDAEITPPENVGELNEMFWDFYSESTLELNSRSFATPRGDYLAIGAYEQRATQREVKVGPSGPLVQLYTVILLPLTENTYGTEFKRITPYDFRDRTAHAELCPISPIGVFDDKFLVQQQSFEYIDDDTDHQRYNITQQIGIFDPRSGEAVGFITAPEKAYNLFQTEEGLEITSDNRKYLFSNDSIKKVMSGDSDQDTRSKWEIKAGYSTRVA